MSFSVLHPDSNQATESLALCYRVQLISFMTDYNYLTYLWHIYISVFQPRIWRYKTGIEEVISCVQLKITVFLLLTEVKKIF